ncbi:MAG TPA: helix-turn-helix transcriptional regulator [Jatrophihabitantaceae bacterium]|jgi:transcriptional regulator with XRE-family HTH domain|nr:helix-turn-helix transcriptional regulator [Jatrophihabitantaceae bacterium]
MTTTVSRSPVGELLRQWRERRRISQLDLSIEADISSRHLSFVETGRSQPSRDMVLRLADTLDVPLRERNHLLLAAGYAPVYGEAALDAPQMAAVRQAIRLVLKAHEPFPAVVVDRGWNLVDANATIDLLTAGAAPQLLEPPVNVLRLALSPDGLAPRIVNLAEWRAHLLARLRREIAVSADERLIELLDELRQYPGDKPDVEPPGSGDVVVPLRIRTDLGELRFLSTVATFGTPLDVTVAELSIESFFPANPETADALRA